MDQLVVVAATAILVVVVAILTMVAEATENTCCRPFNAKNSVHTQKQLAGMNAYYNWVEENIG
jgi:hypothetical protein